MNYKNKIVEYKIIENKKINQNSSKSHGENIHF